MRFLILILIPFLVCQALFGSDGGGNGVDRGGGNGIVCFDQSKIAQSLRISDTAASAARFRGIDGVMQSSYQEFLPIPDSAIGHITSITLLDLQFAQTELNVAGWPHGRITPPEHAPHLPFPGDSTGSIDPEQIRLLNAEYERYIGKFKDSIPSVYRILTNAASILKLENAKAFPVAPECVLDYSRQNIPDSCVIAPIFVQHGFGEDATWGFDSRLFLHPRMSWINRVAVLIHERVYWAARAKNTLRDVDAWNTVWFVSGILRDNLTYRYALQLFNRGIGLGAQYLLPGDVSPCRFLSLMIADIINRSSFRSPSGQSQVDLKVAQQIYVREYQKQVLQLSSLDKEIRKIMDRNLLAYFSGNPIDIGAYLNGQWPADILGSRIPVN